MSATHASEAKTEAPDAATAEMASQGAGGPNDDVPTTTRRRHGGRRKRRDTDPRAALPVASHVCAVVRDFEAFGVGDRIMWHLSHVNAALAPATRDGLSKLQAQRVVHVNVLRVTASCGPVFGSLRQPHPHHQ